MKFGPSLHPAEELAVLDGIIPLEVYGREKKRIINTKSRVKTANIQNKNMGTASFLNSSPCSARVLLSTWVNNLKILYINFPT